jgi:hypothetical protein
MTKTQPSLTHAYSVTKSQPSLVHITKNQLNLAKLTTYGKQPRQLNIAT